MTRSLLFAGSALACLGIGFALPASAAPIETVTVTAQLNNARNGIQTQLGASTYKITSEDIENTPGGANTLLNQVVLQAPSVAQDSFGQLHIRGEHNGVQYRLNGVILPEGISVFGQTLDPRLISSMQLITGALPAEYGLRTAGIIDVTTKSGALDSGGQVSIYGGSHGTIQPSFDYGGSSGNLSYFVSGDFMRNDLGIESPDGSANRRARHDDAVSSLRLCRRHSGFAQPDHGRGGHVERLFPDSRPARPGALRSRRHRRAWPHRSR